MDHSGKDKSHFVSKQIASAADEHRPGPRYSVESQKKIQDALGGADNTSYTTPHFNRGVTKSHENAITAVIRGEKEQSELSDGDKSRQIVQSRHYQKIQAKLQEVAPGLAKQLDNVYHQGDETELSLTGGAFDASAQQELKPGDILAEAQDVILGNCTVAQEAEPGGVFLEEQAATMGPFNGGAGGSASQPGGTGGEMC